MYALLLILIPVIGALALPLFKTKAYKSVALMTALAEFLLACFSFFEIKYAPTSSNLFMSLPWIPDLGIGFRVAIDGANVLLVLLTGIVIPLILVSAFYKEMPKSSRFFALTLVMQSALMGVFLAMDGFLFYIFWELALLPIFFICLIWGGDNKIKITFRFFIYTLLGSLTMLIALIYIYLHTGANGLHSFAINDMYAAGKALSQNEQIFLFILMGLAFAIKLPIFPLHGWQPSTYYMAPTQGTMLLSAIMLKMGGYGLIRWLIPMLPKGVYQCSDIVVTLSIIGIVYASLIAIRQKDLKKLFAYSSLAHVGLISAGIMTMKLQGLQGGAMQMLAHGINIFGLFFIYDILTNRLGNTEIDKMGGIRAKDSKFALLYLIVLLGSVALPLTNGFVGEFLLLNSLYQYHFGFVIPAGLTVILGAVYMLRSYQSIMLGEENTLTSGFEPLRSYEKNILIVVCCLVIMMGIFSNFLLEPTEIALTQIVEIYKTGLN